MNRDAIFKSIRTEEAQLHEYGVKSLAVFGSVARGYSTQDSDVDLLVEFSRPVGLIEFVRLKNFLEKITGCRVDLVTRDALRPEMREKILAEAIDVPLFIPSRLDNSCEGYFGIDSQNQNLHAGPDL